jgi:hypothetical protein
LCWRFEEADQVADGVVAVLGVPERQVLVHFVAVAATVAALSQVASLLEVVDDLRCGALGDLDDLGDVPEPNRRVGADDLEHVGVVCYEPERMIAFT